ncbi:MAG TPA: vitamin K epoxide reductase family protein [Nitrososphaerales archaeon]|nr:vitamin K epoxide reductase family protein [Nitrososphaerales archaeon]
MRASLAFLLLSVVGVGEAFYHAWQEKAFTTNLSYVSFSSYASLMGIPYWVFGVVWFPLLLLLALWSTHFGRTNLSRKWLILLTVGNLFTGYLWYLDLIVINAVTPTYVGLYLTNYALTGVVAVQNWSHREMREFAAGTILGIVIGAFFGAFGAAVLGLAGGVFGAVGGYTSKT